jgi:hypothetical protein
MILYAIDLEKWGKETVLPTGRGDRFFQANEKPIIKLPEDK